MEGVHMERNNSAGTDKSPTCTSLRLPARHLYSTGDTHVHEGIILEESEEECLAGRPLAKGYPQGGVMQEKRYLES